MDRVEYMQSIQTTGGDFTDIIVNHFDQLMWLYNAMPATFDIVGRSFDGTLLHLTIKFDTEETCKKVQMAVSSCSTNGWSIYGHTFHVYRVAAYGNTIELSIGL